MKSTLLLVLLVASVSLAQDHSEHSQPVGASETSTPASGSGTSWLPASTPREMLHFASGKWDFMVHGFANFVYQEESGSRGTSEFFSTNMAMFSAGRTAGKGRFDFRFMASLEPTLGKTGYPLLFQTGETADNVNPLFDRQHPHDLLMEVALRYDHPIGESESFFVYFAPVGEPALGPSAFMHRASSVDNPVSPIAHHWLDSTHITYGVLTLGWSRENKVKLEGSIFNGREPNSERWNVDKLKLDSYSVRATVNPTPNWSVQGSLGFLKAPEQLHPNQDLLRMTASITHNRVLGGNSSWGNWQTMAAWGRNKWQRPPPVDQIPMGGITISVPAQPLNPAAMPFSPKHRYDSGGPTRCFPGGSGRRKTSSSSSPILAIRPCTPSTS
jgi:hypothetical protein